MDNNVIQTSFGPTPYQSTAEDVLRIIEDLVEEDDLVKPDSVHPDAPTCVEMDLDELRKLVNYVRALEKKLTLNLDKHNPGSPG